VLIRKSREFSRDFLLFSNINAYNNIKSNKKEVLIMAINPYLPDMKKIQTAYSSIDVEPISKRFSFTSQYKTAQETIDALMKTPSDTEKILSQMTPELRRDRTEMLKVVGLHEGAYLYAHKDINDDKFKRDAIYRNPNVYGLLQEKDRENPEIIKEYWNSMTYRKLSVKKLDATTEALQFTQRLSSKLPAELAFTPEGYARAYEDMVVKGPEVGPWRPDIVDPHSDREILGEGFLYIATARMLSPGQIPTYDKMEHDVWVSHPEAIKELAFNDRREKRIDDALTAIETRCPEMTLEIKQRQKDYWDSRKQEITDLQVRAAEGDRLNKQEMELVRESMKHLEFSKEEKREMARRVEQKRIESVQALQQDSKEAVYAAHARGEIEFNTATGIAAYIDALPSRGTPYRASEALAQAEAMENNTHNVVEPEAPVATVVTRYDAIDARVEQEHYDRWTQVSNEQIKEDDLADKEIAALERELDELEENDTFSNDRTEDEIYEEEYAGNPFISYEPSEGMTHVYNPFA
jgi:hypothetical protein